MVFAKQKGYRVERKIRILLEKNGWIVVRAGASLGIADLVCIKKGKCILLQIKSTNNKKIYYYGYAKDEFAGIPFFLVVDFGYGKIRILHPKRIITLQDGYSLNNFLKK